MSKLVSELHPIVQDALQKNREDRRNSASKANLPNFMVGDFVLVAREHFHTNEKLSLCLRGPRRVIKAINDYVYEIEDLRNVITDEVHVSRLKFYSDDSLDKEAIRSHVLSSETGMVVRCLLRLEETEDGLCVVVSWKGLPTSENTVEPIANIYKDVPELLKKWLLCKNTSAALAEKAKRILHI